MKIAIIYSNQLIATQLGVLLKEFKPILLSSEDDKRIKDITLEIIITDKKVIITNRLANFSHYYDIPFAEGRILQDVREQQILCDEIDDLRTSNKILQVEVNQKRQIEEHTFNSLKNAVLVQKGLMPNSSYNNDNISLYANVIPAEMLAGDFYFYQPITDNKIFFVIGDVSDKNIDASIYMTRMITSIKSLIQKNKNYDDYIEILANELNEIGKQDNKEKFQYCTMFLGEININKNELTYINAGHDEPYILTENSQGKITPKMILKDDFDENYGPIGAFLGTYKSRIISLPRKYKLYLYTDGVTEAANANGHTLDLDRYGEKRLEKMISKCRFTISSENICKAIEKDILSFKQGAIQNDDITQICISTLKNIKVKGENNESS